MKKPKKIKFADLKRMSITNSPKLPRAINAGGKRLEWVGFTWIHVGKPTGTEPVIVD